MRILSRYGRRAVALFLIVACCSAVSWADSEQTSDTPVLYYRTQCVGTPRADFSVYHPLCPVDYRIQAGDHLTYTYFIAPGSPEATGGVDLDIEGVGGFRDLHIRDAAGIDGHPNTAVPAATKGWVTRDFDLSSLAGRRVTRASLVQEGDTPGTYELFFRRAAIVRGPTVGASLFEGRWDRKNRQATTPNGYSHEFSILVLPADCDPLATPPAELAKLLQNEMAFERACDRMAELKNGYDCVRYLAKADGDKEGSQLLDSLSVEPDAGMMARHDAKSLDATAEAIAKKMASLRLKDRYRAILVAHSHIDFSWLWEWKETTDQIVPSTFRACISFMKQYPEFCFAQSSPGLYEVAEKYPDLMADIRKYVAEGRWELVGGRWTEGDTNLTTPEAAVRLLLLGQLYFKDTFGKIATVGWEPDTFGHAFYLPQLMRQAGMKYYYHGREEGRPSHNPPLFWWEGVDGSRLLALDVGAFSWAANLYEWSVTDVYNGLKGMKEHAGVNSALVVYGVGNHGGAPSREMIEKGREIAAQPYLPTIKFGTAAEFFADLEKRGNLEKLPVYRGELNKIISGAYTSCMNVKQRILEGQRLAQRAEVVALITDRMAEAGYPARQLSQWWKDVLWGQHHDTAGGTSTHAANQYTLKHYDALNAALSSFVADRVQLLASRIKPSGNRPVVLVVNTLAWKRGGLLEIDNPQRLKGLVDAEGKAVPCQAIGGKLLVRTVSLPGAGYATFYEGGVGAPSEATPADAVTVSADGTLMKSARFEVGIDRKTGRVTRLLDTKLSRDWVAKGWAIGALQINHEDPMGGASAWDAGQVVESAELVRPESIKVAEAGPLRGRVIVTYRHKLSTIEQHIILESGADAVSFETHADWHQVGTGVWKDASGKEHVTSREHDDWRKDALAKGKLSAEALDAGVPRLDVGFRLNLNYGKPVFGIPFGDIERDYNAYGPSEGYLSEASSDPEPRRTQLGDKTGGSVAHSALLDWVAIGDGTAGVAITTSEMHGSQVYKDHIQIVLMRSTINPDYQPEDGTYVFRYAFRPYAGALDRATLARVSSEFVNAPLWAPVSKAAGQGDLPDRGSLLEQNRPGLIVTGIKKAEKSDALILRAYNCEPTGTREGELIAAEALALTPVDILERPVAGERQTTGTRHAVSLKPYQVQTWALTSGAQE